MDAAGALALKKYIIRRRQEGFVRAPTWEPAADVTSLPLIDAFVRAAREQPDEEPAPE